MAYIVGGGGSQPIEIALPVWKRKKKKKRTVSAAPTTPVQVLNPPNPIIYPKVQGRQEISLRNKKALNIYAGYWLVFKDAPDPKTFTDFMKMSSLKTAQEYFDFFHLMKQQGVDPQTIVGSQQHWFDYVNKNIPIGQKLTINYDRNVAHNLDYDIPDYKDEKQYVLVPDEKYGEVRIDTYDREMMQEQIAQYNQRNKNQISVQNVYQNDIVGDTQSGMIENILGVTDEDRRRQIFEQAGPTADTGGFFMPTEANLALVNAFAPTKATDLKDANDFIERHRGTRPQAAEEDIQAGIVSDINSIKAWLNHGLPKKYRLKLDGKWGPAEELAWNQSEGMYYTLEAIQNEGKSDPEAKEQYNYAVSRLTELGIMGTDAGGTSNVYDIMRNYMNTRTGLTFNPSNSDEIKRFCLQLWFNLTAFRTQDTAPFSPIVQYVKIYGDDALPDEEKRMYWDMFSTFGSLNTKIMFGEKVDDFMSFLHAVFVSPVEDIIDEAQKDVVIRNIATFGGQNKKIDAAGAAAWDMAYNVYNQSLLAAGVNALNRTEFVKAVKLSFKESAKAVIGTSVRTVSDAIDFAADRIGQAVAGDLVRAKAFFEGVTAELDGDSLTNFTDAVNAYMDEHYGRDWSPAENTWRQLGGSLITGEGESFQKKYEAEEYIDPKTGEVHYRSGETMPFIVMSWFGLDPEQNRFELELANFAADTMYLALLDKGARGLKLGKKALVGTGVLGEYIGIADKARKIAEMKPSSKNLAFMRMITSADDEAAKFLNETTDRKKILEWLKDPKNRAHFYRPGEDFRIPGFMLELRARAIIGAPVKKTIRELGANGKIVTRTVRTGRGGTPAWFAKQFMTRTWTQGPVSLEHDAHWFAYDWARSSGMNPDQALDFAGKTIEARLKAMEPVLVKDMLQEAIDKKQLIVDAIATDVEKATQSELDEGLRLLDELKNLKAELAKTPDDMTELVLRPERLGEVKARLHKAMFDWFEQLPKRDQKRFESYLRKKNGYGADWKLDKATYQPAMKTEVYTNKIPVLQADGTTKWVRTESTILRGQEQSLVIDAKQLTAMRKSVKGIRIQYEKAMSKARSQVISDRVWVGQAMGRAGQDATWWTDANINRAIQIIQDYQGRGNLKIGMPSANPTIAELKKELWHLTQGTNKNYLQNLEKNLTRVVKDKKTGKETKHAKKRLTKPLRNQLPTSLLEDLSAHETRMNSLKAEIANALPTGANVGRVAPGTPGQMSQWFTPPFSLYDVKVFNDGPAAMKWEVLNRMALDPATDLFKNWVLMKLGTMFKIVLADEFWRLWMEGISPHYLLSNKQAAFKALKRENPAIANVVTHLLDSRSGSGVMTLNPAEESHRSLIVKYFPEWADSQLRTPEISDIRMIIADTEKEITEIITAANVVRANERLPLFKIDVRAAAFKGEDDPAFAEVLKYARAKGIYRDYPGQQGFPPSAKPFTEPARQAPEFPVSDRPAAPILADRERVRRVWMTPEKYLSVEAGGVGRTAHADDLRGQGFFDEDNINKLRSRIRNGEEIDSPWFEFKQEEGRWQLVSQEGRQRAIAAREEGVEYIPVDIVLRNKEWTPEIEEKIIGIRWEREKPRPSPPESPLGKAPVAPGDPVYRGVRPGAMAGEAEDWPVEGIFLTRDPNYANAYTLRDVFAPGDDAGAYVYDEALGMSVPATSAEKAYVQKYYIAPDAKVYTYTGPIPVRENPIFKDVPTNALTDLTPSGNSTWRSIYEVSDDISDEDLFNQGMKELKYRRKNEIPDIYSGPRDQEYNKTVLFQWAQRSGYDVIELPLSNELFVANKKALVDSIFPPRPAAPRHFPSAAERWRSLVFEQVDTGSGRYADLLFDTERKWNKQKSRQKWAEGAGNHRWRDARGRLRDENGRFVKEAGVNRFPREENVRRNAEHYQQMWWKNYQNFAGPEALPLTRDIVEGRVTPEFLAKSKAGRALVERALTENPDQFPIIISVVDMTNRTGHGNWWGKIIHGETLPFTSKKFGDKWYQQIPGFYNILDHMSGQMKGAVFMKRFENDLKAFREIGYSTITAERLAMNNALRYSEEVMYSAGKTMFEQSSRNMLLFLPAYRQFLMYWGKKMFTNFILMNGLLNNLNGGRYQDMLNYTDTGEKPFGVLPNWTRFAMPEGMMYSFSNLSFLQVNDKFSNGNWWTQMFPGVGPVPMLIADGIAVNYPELAESMKKIPGLQYINPNTPPNPAWNDISYGFLQKALPTIQMYGMQVPTPGVGRTQEYYEKRFLLDMVNQAFSGEMPSAELAKKNVQDVSRDTAWWNIFSPVARHMLFNDQYYNMQEAHRLIIDAENEDEVNKILEDPRYKAYRPVYEFMTNKAEKAKIVGRLTNRWFNNHDEAAKQQLLILFSLSTSQYIPAYGEKNTIFERYEYSGNLRTPEQFQKAILGRFEQAEEQFFHRHYQKMFDREIKSFMKSAAKEWNARPGSLVYKKLFKEEFGDILNDEGEVSTEKVVKLMKEGKTPPPGLARVAGQFNDFVQEHPTMSGRVFTSSDVADTRKPTDKVSANALNFFNWLENIEEVAPAGFEMVKNSSYYRSFRKQQKEQKRLQMRDFFRNTYAYPSDLTDSEMKNMGLKVPSPDAKIAVLMYLSAVDDWQKYTQSSDYEFNSPEWRERLRRLHGWQEWIVGQFSGAASLVDHGVGWRVLNSTMNLGSAMITKSINDTDIRFTKGSQKVIDRLEEKLPDNPTRAYHMLNEAKSSIPLKDRENFNEYVRAWAWKTLVNKYAEPMREHLQNFYNETMDWNGTSTDSKEGQKTVKKMTRVLMSFMGYRKDKYGKIRKGTPVSPQMAMELRMAIKATGGDISTLARYLVDPYRL